MLYTEHYDKLEYKRIKRCWIGAQSITFKRLLEVTHKEDNRFFMLPQDHIISTTTYQCLVLNKQLSLKHFYAWHKVRRFNDTSCTCSMFLKFAHCHHVFAARIYTCGGRVIPPEALIDYRARVPPDCVSDHEEEDLHDDEDDQPDLDVNDVLETQIFSMPLTRVRMQTSVLNIKDF